MFGIECQNVTLYCPISSQVNTLYTFVLMYLCICIIFSSYLYFFARSFPLFHVTYFSCSNSILCTYAFVYVLLDDRSSNPYIENACFPVFLFNYVHIKIFYVMDSKNASNILYESVVLNKQYFVYCILYIFL